MCPAAVVACKRIDAVNGDLCVVRLRATPVPHCHHLVVDNANEVCVEFERFNFLYVFFQLDKNRLRCCER